MKQMVALALEEDLGPGDCTSESSVPRELVHEGFILAKEQGIVAGIEVARHVFELVDKDVVFEPLMEDGSAVEVGDTILRLKGQARSILSGERLALNFMQRMSGVATMAHQATTLLEGTGAQVLDTRKTTPGLRAFEKWAVSLGGGANHRMGLYDMILIKDNHVAQCGGVEMAVRAAKAAATGLEVQVDQKCGKRRSFECRWLKSASRAVLLSAVGSEVLKPCVFTGFQFQCVRKPNF